jgi:hypothetical protein
MLSQLSPSSTSQAVRNYQTSDEATMSHNSVSLKRSPDQVILPSPAKDSVESVTDAHRDTGFMETPTPLTHLPLPAAHSHAAAGSSAPHVLRDSRLNKTGRLQSMPTAVDRAAECATSIKTNDVLLSTATFQFGDQEVYVSGPAMHQELHLHPDGSLFTSHTSLPLFFSEESTPIRSVLQHKSCLMRVLLLHSLHLS